MTVLTAQQLRLITLLKMNLGALSGNKRVRRCEPERGLKLSFHVRFTCFMHHWKAKNVQRYATRKNLSSQANSI